MSNVNIRRLVENIRANTNHYTPIVEIIVNAIQAIEEKNVKSGHIVVQAVRDKQVEIDDSLAAITGFMIMDNGVGFNRQHRDSFDTLYSDLKVDEGGKGFGRFVCLKYFKNLHIESVYEDSGNYYLRKFTMGKDSEIITEEIDEICEEEESRTLVHLEKHTGSKPFEKKLATLGKNLVERLLPYFITEDYDCPEIILSESDGGDSIKLNDFIGNELANSIEEIPLEKSSFEIKTAQSKEQFHVKVFKIFSPSNLKSRISLVAHKREVSGAVLHRYVPEFIEDFFEKGDTNNAQVDRNFILKAYIFGAYLDNHVSLERGGFEFGADRDLIYGIGQSQIEREAATIAKEAMGSELVVRQEKKRQRVMSYVDEQAPWHKTAVDSFDLSELPYNATESDMEAKLQKEKFKREQSIRTSVANMLDNSDNENLRQKASDIVNKISDTSKNDLIHYVALRRSILEIFDRSLQVDDSGHYSSEGVVHDIIFPRKSDSDSTSFEDHNLWMIDERLNFTSFVSSDNPLSPEEPGRPDLLVYNRRILFRGENEATNPVSIFEFKKPQRDDFVNPSSDEDPVQQVVRYVNNIREGKAKTTQGRKILIAPTTPFYGYVICDLTPKVSKWLELEKDFTPMPDGLGWFQWKKNINLYIEVLSWDKILRDATLRNKIFFEHLGI
jgi:hypothetical protein